jgi:hypothetical protein
MSDGRVHVCVSSLPYVQRNLYEPANAQYALLAKKKPADRNLAEPKRNPRMAVSERRYLILCKRRLRGGEQRTREVPYGRVGVRALIFSFTLGYYTTLSL